MTTRSKAKDEARTVPSRAEALNLQKTWNAPTLSEVDELAVDGFGEAVGVLVSPTPACLHAP